MHYLQHHDRCYMEFYILFGQMNSRVGKAVVCGGLFFGLTVALGASPHRAANLILVAVLASAAVIDLKERRVPNWLVLAGALLAICIYAVTDRDYLPEALLAAVAAGSLLLLAALLYPTGMGMGDVKLAAVMGLYLGGKTVSALIVALVVGSLAGLIYLVRHGRAGRKQTMPFAPCLAVGGAVALLSGNTVWEWYTGLF